MSIRLLQEDVENHNKDITSKHTASDDLESMFYIFVEFATTFDGPRGATRDANRRPMWVDSYETLGSACWVTKQGYVLSPPIDVSLMRKTTSFFASFGPIIQEWRHLILAAASTKSNTNDSIVEVTHEALVALLEKWIAKLPPDVPEEIAMPIASSSRLTHPPPDILSSTAPRHSMRLHQKSG